jgi:hypothetical protein
VPEEELLALLDALEALEELEEALLDAAPPAPEVAPDSGSLEHPTRTIATPKYERIAPTISRLARAPAHFVKTHIQHAMRCGLVQETEPLVMKPLLDTTEPRSPANVEVHVTQAPAL